MFVVAAAIREATFSLRPRAFALFLICSYCLLRLGLFTPRGGVRSPPFGCPHHCQWRADSILIILVIILVVLVLVFFAGPRIFVNDTVPRSLIDLVTRLV